MLRDKKRRQRDKEEREKVNKTHTHTYKDLGLRNDRSTEVHVKEDRMTKEGRSGAGTRRDAGID